jgi:hypothetical protein
MEFMKFLLKCTLPLLAMWFAAVAKVSGATTVNWGSPLDSVLRDSYGNTLGPDMHFQLGTFANSFIPTFENMADWKDNWRVFDEALYFPEYGWFVGSADIDKTTGQTSSSAATGDSDTFDFRNKNAFLWVFNDQTPEVWVTQWTLVRDSSWVFPVPSLSCCDTSLPQEWSLSDLGPGDKPIFGRTGEEEGGGTSYAESPSYDLQTYSLVPEISSVPAMVAVVLLVGCHRDRRRKHTVPQA